MSCAENATAPPATTSNKASTSSTVVVSSIETATVSGSSFLML